MQILRSMAAEEVVLKLTTAVQEIITCARCIRFCRTLAQLRSQLAAATSDSSKAAETKGREIAALQEQVSSLTARH